LAAIIPACAPRVTVAPISPDTPPDRVLEMVRAKDAGLEGIKALVKITVEEKGEGPKSFDGVLYVAKPDKVRLTGLSFMGFTVFDAVIRDDKFYFYQPDTGYMYTGERGRLSGFLKSLGVDADPELIYRALMSAPSDGKDRYLLDRTEEGYSLYLVKDGGGALTPVMRSDYDPGLNLVGKAFYDELARPYMFAEHSGRAVQDGLELPVSIKATDTMNGYTVTVRFDKYIVNPEDIDKDFTIEGGELKGIRTVP
jgi:outer membrane lipoprotein-sorting protein